MKSTVEMAGTFAAHGIWCVSDGGPLLPMMAFEKPDGTRELTRFVMKKPEDGVAAGRDQLEKNPEAAVRAVLVCDGHMTLPSGKSDALIIEMRQYGPPVQSLTMAVPYRGKDDPAGFAVFRPKFLSADESGAGNAELGAAFFEGVEKHEEGAKIWSKHLDESQ